MNEKTIHEIAEAAIRLRACMQGAEKASRYILERLKEVDGVEQPVKAEPAKTTNSSKLPCSECGGEVAVYEYREKNLYIMRCKKCFLLSALPMPTKCHACLKTSYQQLQYQEPVGGHLFCDAKCHLDWVKLDRPVEPGCSSVKPIKCASRPIWTLLTAKPTDVKCPICGHINPPVLKSDSNWRHCDCGHQFQSLPKCPYCERGHFHKVNDSNELSQCCGCGRIFRLYQV